MELLVYPVIFYLAKRWSLRHELADEGPADIVEAGD
jgi:hypothetical protein